MRFHFFPLRFEFVARESIYFAPWKAGNILRGGFGVIFKRLACAPECQDARSCDARETCPYARVFEPGSQALGSQRLGPSGLADWPRPFVFRARHLDGCVVEPGQPFHFDLNIFSLEQPVIDCFVRSFEALAHEGLGPRRGKAELTSVRSLALGEVPEQVLYEGTEPMTIRSAEPAWLDLAPLASAPDKVRVEFLSPTELKHEAGGASRPDFPILFGRIRDRISTLRALYGPGPLEIDFLAMGERAAAVRLTDCQVRRVEVGRRSSRTGQTHSIGGFVGAAEYEGELAEFLPYLEAGRWVGVGRQAVWGKGEIAVSRSASSIG